MRTRTRIALAGLLAATACAGQAEPEKAAPAPAASAAPSQASALVAPVADFGPPQGEPIRAVLTDAPEVPPAVNRNYPAKVIVDLEVKEVTLPMADGVDYTFWTFGGRVPGKFIRIRQGDTVEMHLKNHPTSKMPHNIDLHAVSGPGGGAKSSFTAPGHESVFTFKAVNAGLFVYHCATAPVGMHIANGMYGMILVEPPGGLPPADREFYVMQGDFYTEGRYHDRGLQAFDMQKAIDERPTYVLFNGAEGSLTGEHALQAKSGQRVRLFVGNGGPNLVSSFHVIGAVFDKVFTEGGARFQENVQTTLIPSGGAAMAEFNSVTPGEYALVDHSIFRAFNKGAVGVLKVEGGPYDNYMTGKQADLPYTGEEGRRTETSALPVAPAPVAQPVAAPAPAPAKPVEAAKPAGPDAFAAGRAIFTGTCAACHQADGQGVPNAIPPLAGSDFLAADKKRAIGVVLNGLSGPVTVNGKSYSSMMPKQAQLSDQDVANVLTFVRANLGNHGDGVSLAEVKAVAKQ